MIETVTGPIPLQTKDTPPESVPSTPPPQPRSRCRASTPFSTPSYSAASPAPRLLIATGGQYIRLRRPRSGPPERREWTRGNVTHFSARSRSRMLQSVAQIDTRAATPDVLFVTFTYPRWYPASTRICKQHLEAFRKRLTRVHPAAWFYWKLEYQVRGAPHFHLMLFNAGTTIETWYHDAWFGIVGSGEHFHWFYGADVRRVHSWREVTGYCAKYTAKESTQAVCDSPGRFWGIANRANRPATLVEAELTDGEFYAIRRMLRRYMGVKRGFHQPGGRDSGVWARLPYQAGKDLAEWAAREYHPLRGQMLSPPPPGAGGPDTQPCDTGRYSRDGWPAARQMTFARSGSTPTLPLYSAEDAQRARALARA